MLRLKTADISYTVPKKYTTKMSIDNLRLFVNGNNLWLWSKLPVDVEGTSFSEKRYPTSKNINVGMNITL